MQMFLTPEEKIIEQLRTENAALKEQVAQWETEYNGCSALLNNAERTIETLEETIAQQAGRIVELNKECNSHYETCQQQAEAIRLKDEALLNLLSVIDSEAYPTIQNNGYDAVAIQPYPEILQTRDERVAEACALLCHHEAHVMSAHGDSGVEGANWCGSQIRNGGWKEYL